MNLLVKIYKKIRCLLTIIKFKLLYGKRFQCPWNANITPSLIVRISSSGEVIIGRRCSFRENVILNASCGKIIIGDECFFNDFVCINARDKIEIGAQSILGQAVRIYDHDHDFHSIKFYDDFVCNPILIGNNVWIGSNVTVLRGTIIEDYCVIGAGSIVKGKLEEHTLFYNKIVPYVERIFINNDIV